MMMNKEGDSTSDNEVDLDNMEDKMLLDEMYKLTQDINSTINIIRSYLPEQEMNINTNRISIPEIIESSKKLLLKQTNVLNDISRKINQSE